MNTAQANKDATDLQLALERREKIASDYRRATAVRDAKLAALNEFKAEYGGPDEFDETLIEDAEIYAHYE
jgi:hypothetical protein